MRILDLLGSDFLFLTTRNVNRDFLTNNRKSINPLSCSNDTKFSGFIEDIFQMCGYFSTIIYANFKSVMTILVFPNVLSNLPQGFILKRKNSLSENEISLMQIL